MPDAERAKLFDADGWYRTGDLMRRLPDGRYQMMGRAKDLIKVGGENVTSAEIEAALMRHPSVSLAAVVARADLDRGEVPVAYVELTNPGEVTMADVRLWSKANMAPFKVPADFYEMSPGDWPMTATGKIAKHLLVQG
jgi:fatty-acyl-CoA synthase